MLLKDKAVFITGASAGIGRAAAIGAARAGADVAINYLGKADGAVGAVAEIEALGRRAVAIEGDVSDPRTAHAFVQGGVAALGRLDVLVSNAGICPFHAFLDMPGEIFERTMAVNLHGAFYMVQAAANQMVRQGHGGAIVAVSSISALVGGEYQTHYTPTKAGVHSLMQSAAIALGKHGIRCNSVMPGTIETDINREDLADARKRKYMESRIPLGRLGEPGDLTGPILFLASDLARYVTGASLLVDGGMFVNLQEGRPPRVQLSPHGTALSSPDRIRHFPPLTEALWPGSGDVTG
jgi:L-rhamnose 1-dehydrogenase